MPPKQTDMPLDFSDASISDGHVRDAGSGARPNQRSRSPHGDSKAWQHTLIRTLLRQTGDPAVAVRLWDGTRFEPRGDGAQRPVVGTVTITSPSALMEIVKRQDVGIGDEFSAGNLLIDGPLVDVLVEIERGRQRARSSVATRLISIAPRITTRRPRLNSLAGSKNNIGHHYNIGNDFYRLWLDQEAMQYTCAYFSRPDMTIEQAQLAKLEHICRKLELKPGDEVIEAGSGWGGLSRYIASRYGARVTAYNISSEQVKYATEQAKATGLEDRIEYVEDDYRNITGSCDRFVSVGMLEHVGIDNFGELGTVADRVMRDDARGLIHSIGRNKPRLMNPWIEKRIFPGAYPPSIREIMGIFEEPNFSVLDVENLRLHYARTLDCWLERFDENEEQIRTMFDTQFIRAWRLYLAGSIAAFKTSTLQLFQVTFARGTDNSVPFTREHLYQENA